MTFVIACSSAVGPTPTTPSPEATTSEPDLAVSTTSTPTAPSEEATSTPTSAPVEIARGATSSRGQIVVDLNAVPMVDLAKHSVPLEDIVFDTFDGRSSRLSAASERLIERLRDAIRPIYNPRYGDAKELPWLVDRDLIVGYASAEDAYAYPVKVLDFRELVNDVIDDVPLLISYCPLCASGVVYNRRLEGRTLLFGNTSALYQSDLVMYDHQTGSYWFQVLGEALVGEMTGKRLTALPSMTVSWGEWKLLYPETLLMVGDSAESFALGYGADSFAGYPDTLDRGMFPFPVSEEKLDNRLRNSEIVITAEVNSSIRAYPLRLIGEAAVNDQVGGQAVVVFSSGVTGSAFLATVAGMELSFGIKDGLFIDEETGSTWNMAGRSVAGVLQGKNLEPIPSRRAFWFSIAGAVPDLELYLP